MRGGLFFAILLAASTAAMPGYAQPLPASAKITFIGVPRDRYVLIEADFALDNHPLATLNESADPAGTVLFNRELPPGDHLFAAELSYRRAGGGLFSNGTGPVLRVSGSLQFHAEAGQALTITSRIQPRVDVIGKSEWLSLSTVIDSTDTSASTVAKTAEPTTPPTRYVTITAPASTPDEPARPESPPEKKSAETAGEVPTEPPAEKPAVAVKKKKGSATSAALLRLRMKLHAAATQPPKPKAKKGKPVAKNSGGDAAANRLKSLLRKAAAKNSE